MTEPQPPLPVGMNWSLAGLIPLVPAVAVSTAAIYLAAGADRLAIGLATSPFGWDRVIVVHVLASLLLAWAVARALTQWIPGLKLRWTVVLWIAVGAALAWVTVAAGGFVGRALESAQAGYVARLLVRVVWCTVLQVPWCLMGQAAGWHWRPGSADARQNSFSLGNLFALAVVVAVAVPVSYLEILTEQQTKIARELWDSFRIEEARRVVSRICDLGSTRDFGTARKLGGGSESTEQVSPQLALKQLESTLEYARTQIKSLGSGELTDQQRLELVRWLVALGMETQEAVERAGMEDLARRDAAAALNLGEMYCGHKDWQSGRRWLRRALRLAQSAQPSDAAEVEANLKIQRRCYELIALVAGEEGDYEAAEQYLLEALERLPNQRAFFHNQLGLHYEYVGRPLRAIEHFKKAADLAPQEYHPPEGPLAKILSSGTQIGLFRKASSRHK